MTTPFYLTTAIDYANGDPHLGHAFEKIGADAIARFHRQAGRPVHFLMGMDEHGQKVAQTAEERGVTPHALVDEVAARFEETWARLGISYDQFVRTATPAHHHGVRALMERIFQHNPDDFYEKAYEGWYCVGCEAFKSDGEIVDGKCPLHPTRELQWTAERNWFFRLSRYQDFLVRLLRERPEFCQPESRRNEILGLLEQGLEDVSASRARFAWGVPFPRPTSDGETQTTYVWFDALPGYLTPTGFPDGDWEKRWPAQLHVIGKDITRFHCVIWPAMLEAARLPLPERVWAHGFLSFEGQRFSKSAGVWVELDEAIARHGADAFRYYLLREMPYDGDGDFSWERFDARYTGDLANALGNLASRTIAMVEKYCDGVVPSAGAAAADGVDARDLADLRDYVAAMDGTRGYLPNEALAALWRTVARANEHVQASAPWALAKDAARRAELEAVLATLVRALARQAVCLAPFLPNKAEELWAQLGGPGAGHATAAGISFDALASLDVGDWKVTKGAALFPRPAVVKG